MLLEDNVKFTNFNSSFSKIVSNHYNFYSHILDTSRVLREQYNSGGLIEKYPGNAQHSKI